MQADWAATGIVLLPCSSESNLYRNLHPARNKGEYDVCRVFAGDEGTGWAGGGVQADVVQQVFVRAHAAWPGLQRTDRPVLAAWLRRILADVVKHYDRDRRAVDLQRSLEAEMDQSASGLAGWLAADQTSPSEAAQRNEEPGSETS